ncbi:carbohydrate binding domain-containing protein [Streptomyces sp. NPDC001714]|uniref:carbohydrate binding domain-containing protein n=1 Tax=Streptomyces sp. NPDC001714 TaxID=3364603 RepID=UPI0036BB6C41
MAFPDTPLSLKGELRMGQTWVNVTGDLYTRDPISHTRGRPYKSNAADPSACSATFRNVDGTYTPRNAEGTFYGQFNRNTPFRFTLPGGPVHLELADAADSATTPDAAALDITADIDVRWEGEADWYAAGAQFLIGKWGAAGNRSYNLRLQNGRLIFNTTSAGTTIDGGGYASLPGDLPRRAAVRATIDADNGAGGFTLRLYWATSLAGPWVQFSTDVIGPAPISIFAGTAPLSIAPQQTGGSTPGGPVAGTVYKAEVRSGIGGTVVAAPDFTAQAVGATSFTDSAGRVWTVAAGAQITDRITRFEGEVPEWPAKWETSGRDGWVSVKAGGILRRFGQGKKSLQSALRRRIPSYKPLAYWPLEDGVSASQAVSPLARITPLKLRGVRWAQDTSVPASGALPVLNPTTSEPCTMLGRIPAPVSTPTEWGVQWLFRIDTVNTTMRTYMRVLSTGTVAQWLLQANSTGFTVIARDDDGTTLTTKSYVWGTLSTIAGKWIKAEFNVVQSGSSIAWHMGWVTFDGNGVAANDSLTATIGRPTAVASPADGYAADLAGMVLGHITAWPTADNLGYENAITAWSGETAGARMRRLCQEEGVSLAITGNLDDTVPMGPQRALSLLDLLRECANTDGGIFGETADRRQLLYRTRASLYNQAPKLVLDYAAGHIAPPFEPVEDDTIRNEWTVQRDGGSSGTATLDEGALSVLDPPDGIGLVDDSVTLNLATDEQTEPMANWLLHVSTWDDSRYPSVTLYLHKFPELIPGVLDLHEGDKIRIINLPKRFTGGGTVDLLVDGWAETFLPRAWTITYTCAPAGPWSVAAAGDVVLGKADTDGSALAAAVGTADTVLSVAVNAGLLWTPDPAEAPWDIRVGGEIMTVTAVGQVLNDNPDFEAGITGWTAFGGGTISTSTAQAKTGTRSCLLTTNGAATPRFEAKSVTVTAGAQYRAAGWVYAAQAFTAGVSISVNWYNSAGTFLSTTSNTRVPGVGVWELYNTVFTAPATAARAGILLTCAGTPASGLLIYADGIHLIAVTSYASSPQAMTVTRSVNGIVKPQPAGADVRLAYPATVAL